MQVYDDHCLNFATPLKTKSGLEVSLLLDNILKKPHMKHFQTDEGTEWLNRHTRVQKTLMIKFEINHYAYLFR